MEKVSFISDKNGQKKKNNLMIANKIPIYYSSGTIVDEKTTYVNRKLEFPLNDNMLKAYNYECYVIMTFATDSYDMGGYGFTYNDSHLTYNVANYLEEVKIIDAWSEAGVSITDSSVFPKDYNRHDLIYSILYFKFFKNQTEFPKLYCWKYYTYLTVPVGIDFYNFIPNKFYNQMIEKGLITNAN